MEKYSFFNSVNHDRKYNADDICDYLASFFSNGIFINNGDALQVLANNDMSVTVKPGSMFINGKRYINTDDLLIPIENADGVLNRIDSIVIQLDKTQRLISAKVVKGEFSTSAKAPDVKRNADFYELKLCTIKILKGVTKITQSAIADTRLDDNVCGITHNPLEHIDTHTLYLQIQADLKEFKNVEEADFLEWFKGIKDILDDNVAGNLLDRIVNIENGTTKVKEAEKSDSTPWTGVTGKPSTFPPSNHSTPWSEVTGKPSTFPPSTHNHGGVGTFPPASNNVLTIALDGSRNGYIESINSINDTVSNCPQGLKMIATKLQYVNGPVHATVWLYEVYPVNGRIWVNTYNTKWTGWIQVTESHVGLTMMNGWHGNGHGPLISKVGNVVSMNAIFTGGTNTANSVMAKIPEGYRPYSYVYASSLTAKGNGVVMIDSSGNITIKTPALWNDITQICAMWLIEE